MKNKYRKDKISNIHLNYKNTYVGKKIQKGGHKVNKGS